LVQAHQENGDSHQSLKDLQVQVPPQQQTRKTNFNPQFLQTPTRYAGYGGYSKQHKGLIETNPGSLEGTEVDGNLVFEVQGIVDHRKEKNGKSSYRIRWVGYPPSEDTWEPQENLCFAKQALREYNKRKKR